MMRKPIPLALVAAMLLALAVGAAHAGNAFRPVGDADDEEAQAWLGVQLQPVDGALAEALELEDERGALVNDVSRRSPADRAGIEKGDVIVGFEGRSIEAPSDLVRAVERGEPGDKVKIQLIRDGGEITIAATLGSRPRRQARMGRKPDIHPPHMALHRDILRRGARLGVQIEEMDDDLAAYFGTKSGRGVLVTSVIEESPAEEAGMKSGDVILEVNGNKVGSTGELLERVREKEPGDKIELLVLRERRERKVEVTLAEMDLSFGGDKSWMQPFNDSMHGLMKRFDRNRHDGQERVREEMDRLRKELDKLRGEIEELKEKMS